MVKATGAVMFNFPAGTVINTGACTATRVSGPTISSTCYVVSNSVYIILTSDLAASTGMSFTFSPGATNPGTTATIGTVTYTTYFPAPTGVTACTAIAIPSGNWC